MKKYAVYDFLLRLLFPKLTKEIDALYEDAKKLANSIRLKQAEIDKSERRIRHLERRIKKMS